MAVDCGNSSIEGWGCVQGTRPPVMHSARSHTSAVSHTSTSSAKAERKRSGAMSRILEGIFGASEDSELAQVWTHAFTAFFTVALCSMLSHETPRPPFKLVELFVVDQYRSPKA